MTMEIPSATLSWDDLAQRIQNLRKQGKKVVFTNGCFDLLHVGHVRYLEAAKKLGDVLVVGLNSDDSVKRLKGPTRPIQRQEDRAEILAALKSVDFVTIFNEDTPLNLILTLKPDVLVKGGDWSVENIVGAKEVLSWGGEVYSLPYIPDRSTTGLVKKITLQGETT